MNILFVIISEEYITKFIEYHLVAFNILFKDNLCHLVSQKSSVDPPAFFYFLLTIHLNPTYTVIYSLLSTSSSLHGE